MFTIADKRKDIAEALSPPPRKGIIASALAIYPRVYLVLPALRPHTEKLPQWLGSLVTAGVLTPLSTLIMIPAVGWAVKRWLYKPA